jgi:hypothetical protein
MAGTCDVPLREAGGDGAKDFSPLRGMVLEGVAGGRQGGETPPLQGRCVRSGRGAGVWPALSLGATGSSAGTR